MRRLVVNTFLTLDGVMQAPGGPAEDESGMFELGGWSVKYWNEAMDRAMGETMNGPFNLVLGRKTYDIFASYWPSAPEEAGGKPLNDATKYVASRGRPTLGWAHSQLIEGDAAEGVARLKEQDGPELQVHGSADLLQTLMRHRLVDEFRLWTFPVVLGSGKRLFADGAIPTALDLVRTEVFSTGVIMGWYRPAGEVQTGSF